MRRRLTILGSAVAIAALAAGRAAAMPVRAPTKEMATPHAGTTSGTFGFPAGTWTHGASGARFPAGYNGFARDKGIRYDDAARDISVGYNRRSIRGSVAATVYVFPAAGPATDASLDSAFARVWAEIAAQHPRAKIAGQGETTSTAWFGSGRWRAFTAEENGKGLWSAPVMSEVYLYRTGDFLVQHRFTQPLDGSEYRASVIWEFVETVPAGMSPKKKSEGVRSQPRRGAHGKRS